MRGMWDRERQLSVAGCQLQLMSVPDLPHRRSRFPRIQITGQLTPATIGATIGDKMVNELRAVVSELGGERALGRALSNDHDLRDAIREGFRPAVVEELMRASGLTLKELAGALDLSSGACSAAAAADAWLATSPIVSIVWPGLLPWRMNRWAIASVRCAGSNVPIALWGALRR